MLWIQARRSVIKLSKFQAAFWITCLISVLFTGVMFSFVNLGIVFFKRKFGSTVGEASFACSGAYLLAAMLSPFTGALMDRVGRNASWGVLCIVLQLSSSFMLAFTFAPPLVSAGVLGVSYAFVNTYWSALGWLVPESAYGSALGLMLAFSSGGGATVALLAGNIVDLAGYWCAFVLLVIYDAFALSLAVLLLILSHTQLSALRLDAAASKRTIRDADVN